jgi:hypothetical protein
MHILRSPRELTPLGTIEGEANDVTSSKRRRLRTDRYVYLGQLKSLDPRPESPVKLSSSDQEGVRIMLSGLDESFVGRIDDHHALDKGLLSGHDNVMTVR